jgi:uncharacterized protein YutE (UPF0331/DUF86 family)
MKREEDIRKRVSSLLNPENLGSDVASGEEMFNSTLNILTVLYGQESYQTQSFIKGAEVIRERDGGSLAAFWIKELADRVLRGIIADLDAGIVGNLQGKVVREVLTDFLQLARATSKESGNDAKNVAAVLTAALFEDTIRRMARSIGIPHIEKLQDIITQLKEEGIIQGPQVGIAISYLNFRNRALHAQWDQIERESVASVLGFVEELLEKHFP